MPFICHSSRQFDRHLITFEKVELANAQVTREMENLGLWCPRLDEVTVWHVPASFRCYGWFQPGGDIYIPAINGAQLSDFLFGYYTRLTDVLRHEWAHALADRRPRLIKSKRFQRIFGGRYEIAKPVAGYHPDQHLTSYAATMPCEDFAETFHFYLRHKGRLPVRLRTKAGIARKWDFIASMAGQ